MMIDPSVKKLMEGSNPENPRFESRYSLVIAAAKRAREICKTGVSFTECKSNKPVTVAVNEIAENKISFKKKAPKSEALSLDMLLNMYLEEDRNKKAQ